jgi:hypothetical protein
MQVRHVLSGETRHFRAWAEMVAFMKTVIEDLGPERT